MRSEKNRQPISEAFLKLVDSSPAVGTPDTIERASHLIIVIKNWERIADQATNIAEEVLFIIGGVSVKHPYLQAPPEG